MGSRFFSRLEDGISAVEVEVKAKAKEMVVRMAGEMNGEDKIGAGDEDDDVGHDEGFHSCVTTVSCLDHGSLESGVVNDILNSDSNSIDVQNGVASRAHYRDKLKGLVGLGESFYHLEGWI